MGRLTRGGDIASDDGAARDGVVVVDCVCVDFMYMVVFCVSIRDVPTR